MHRQSKNINAPLEVKENESSYTKEKEEASFPDLSKDQKICKAIKSKVTKASKKENLSDGNQAQLEKCTLKYTKGLKKKSYHKEDVVSCQFTECFFNTLKGDMVGERTLPLNSKENFSSRPVSLRAECYLTPNRDEAEEKSDCAVSEKQRKKPVDFRTVTIAEFGITQENFTKHSIGKSPTSLKYRRRSAIGVRGSPENNTLIQYLAQQRSNRQKAAFTQVSPFKRENVRLLKDKIDVFQQSFQSVQEAEGETGFSGQSQVDDASQEAGCSPNKVPYTKERNLDQWSEKFMSDNSRADLQENLSQNLTNSSKSDTRICTTLSLCQDAAVTEPAAAVSKKWVYEQHNPIESLEAVLIRDTLETGHDFSSDHITKDVRSNVISDLSRKKVSFGEELSLEIFDESKPLTTPPITPLQTGNTSLNEHTQSGSHLRSVLKKTPVKLLMDSMKEYLDDAVDGGGGESLAISNCAKIFEALQTEKTEIHSSEKPKRKRVTFGEVLSPEIFDETLPANTPLRKGATPVRHPGLQSNSPFARSSLIEEPLSQPNFDCNDECLEPLQELVEGPVAAEDLLPVENAEAETDKSDMIKTRSSTKRKCSTISEGTDFSISRATNTKNVKDTKNPRKNRFQKQKNITTSAAKKTPKIKHTGYGKRRKKKVKKSLYGERELASKKPLLSPIPEIPEFFSSASSPNSPKANVFFSEDIFLDDTKSGNAHKDVQQKPAVERMRGRNVCAVHMYSSSKVLDIAEASSSNNTMFQVSDGDLKSVSGIDHKFSNIVPDAKCGFATSDHFQRGKETACVKEAKESGSLIENEKLQGNLLNKAERLSGLEFLEQEDTSVPEGAQRTQCPPTDSIRGSPPRRRRSSSAIYFPPVEKLEITGNDFPVSSFDVEEVLSAPQLKNDSLEPFRRKSGDNGERRVRRSMRLHKDAEIEGLAWIQVPNEIPKNPPLLASACKTRRTISTSVLTESENIHHREQNLIQFLAPGKENNDSVNPADGPCKRWKRKTMCVSTPQEATTWSQTRKRSITNSVYRKVRRNPKHYEEVEIPLENNI
ncbi:cell division cycle-associated protein 2 isoform X2 [Aquila chrysaetos chrysaetos]|uniref:cell division cycle-associated protein 2 isoform X2 n=1 Tax=Aquila chrysaetos chrysaetos TaxID=223781 RepID=UPI0005D0E382|nr:cell division cycle-associated protein 2 isoform X2 [Aquila chrysaetos chrysaetos]